MTLHLKRINGFGYGNGGGGGGGNIGKGAYNVKVIDYDGTVIAEQKLDDGKSFKLPKAPTHEGLVFQEWVATKNIVDGKIVIDGNDVLIGAIYGTVSGQSEFDIDINSLTGLTVTLNMAGTKDWGDGTSDTETSHTYSEAGQYTIKCNGTTMTTSSGLFGQLSSSPNKYVKAIRFDNISELTNSACAYCDSLSYVNVSNKITTIQTSCFNNCYINQLIIPDSATGINSNVSQYCNNMKDIIMKSSANYAFLNNYGLIKIIISEKSDSIGQGFVANCQSLKKLTIPKNIKTINQQAFNSCTRIIEYDFSKHTEVPTLSNANAFNAINPICKIKVPSALYDEWIAEANWVTYEDYIVKA